MLCGQNAAATAPNARGHTSYQGRDSHAFAHVHGVLWLSVATVRSNTGKMGPSISAGFTTILRSIR